MLDDLLCFVVDYHPDYTYASFDGQTSGPHAQPLHGVSR